MKKHRSCSLRPPTSLLARLSSAALTTACSSLVKRSTPLYSILRVSGIVPSEEEARRERISGWSASGLGRDMAEGNR